MVPRNNDWCFYDNQKHIIIDEFDGTLYTISQLQEMVDAKCFTVNTKGGSKLLTPDVIFYITSRYPPEGCYPENKRESLLSHNPSHHHQRNPSPHNNNNPVARAAPVHKQDVQGLYNRFFVHQMTIVYPSSSTVVLAASDQLPPKKANNSCGNSKYGDNNCRGKTNKSEESVCPQYGFRFFAQKNNNRVASSEVQQEEEENENTSKKVNMEEEEEIF
jgi:hypothetical protein